MFGRATSPEHVEPLSMNEPIALEALHSQHRLRRRETVIEQDARQGLEIGQLFLSSEEERAKIGMSRGKIILSRPESLVGEL